ncbi:hypothetical protein JCM21714_3471 [Gracilibacillus boraciitolerans JCM 21714]|uniref:Uncharacterized protein n=1 Tax=Gracilibacillus boraciitolerans JCM 21714 TaxID=1298598 RepID=W4VNH9_9BACI
MTNNYPTFEEIRNLKQELYQMRLEYWIAENLFTFQWWLLLVVFFVPWIIWLRVVDRKRIPQILLFGALLMILVIMMDDIGMELNLWSYPYQLIPIMPRLLPIDQGIIIVAHMILYQYFPPRWKQFIIANTVMALSFTFIFEPLTVWLGIYKLENWRYIYSLPIYILKATLIKWLVDEIILKK